MILYAAFAKSRKAASACVFLPTIRVLSDCQIFSKNDKTVITVGSRRV